MEGDQRTFESNLTFNFVGADGQFHGDSIFVVTVDADGDVTASVDRINFDCSF